MTDRLQISGQVVGERARPRILVAWNGDHKEDVLETVATHAGSWREITELSDVRQADYDIFITNDIGSNRGTVPHHSPASHLCVFAFMPEPPSYFAVDSWRSTHRNCLVAVSSQSYYSDSIVVPDELISEAADLVRGTLLPATMRNSKHRALALSSNRGQYAPPRIDEVVFELQPFLVMPSPESHIIAGWYKRSSMSEGWAVPSYVGRPGKWIRAALGRWSAQYRRFPFVGGWWERPEWQTSAEASASAHLAEVKNELAVTMDRLAAELKSVTADLDNAQQEAVSGQRRLLTAKGTPLVEAVIEAFESLEYTVIDLDEQEQDEAGRREDLALSDPDDVNSDPLVEIKGYDNGARVGDIGRITRHLARSLQRERTPTALWWVINHWRSKPPDDRDIPLKSEAATVAEHASDDPPLVLIDTVQLFKAVRAVEVGKVAASDVRESLRNARGPWSSPN